MFLLTNVSGTNSQLTCSNKFNIGDEQIRHRICDRVSVYPAPQDATR